jgi:hypothetical protein
MRREKDKLNLVNSFLFVRAKYLETGEVQKGTGSEEGEEGEEGEEDEEDEESVIWMRIMKNR